MSSSGPTQSSSDFDTALILANIESEQLPDGILFTEGDPADGLIVMGGGQIRYTAKTPYGEHEVLCLDGPIITGLAEFGSFGHRICDVTVKGVQKAARISGSDAKEILADESRLGVALRRLCLGTLEKKLRICNEQLLVYFNTPHTQTVDPRRTSGSFPAVKMEKPVDPREFQQLLDVPHLETSELLQLGLIKRTYAPGAKLTRKGERGDEAFFIQSGRLRVSLQIPGVGEEALTILGAGQIAGEMALIEDSPRSADLIAHESQLEVFVLNRVAFRKLLTGSIAGSGWLVSRIVSALCRRLADTILRSVSFFVLSGGGATGPQVLPDGDDDHPEDLEIIFDGH